MTLKIEENKTTKRLGVNITKASQLRSPITTQTKSSKRTRVASIEDEVGRRRNVYAKIQKTAKEIKKESTEDTVLNNTLSSPALGFSPTSLTTHVTCNQVSSASEDETSTDRLMKKFISNLLDDFVKGAFQHIKKALDDAALEQYIDSELSQFSKDPILRKVLKNEWQQRRACVLRQVLEYTMASPLAIEEAEERGVGIVYPSNNAITLYRGQQRSSTVNTPALESQSDILDSPSGESYSEEDSHVINTYSGDCVGDGASSPVMKDVHVRKVQYQWNAEPRNSIPSSIEDVLSMSLSSPSSQLGSDVRTSVGLQMPCKERHINRAKSKAPRVPTLKRHKGYELCARLVIGRGNIMLESEYLKSHSAELMDAFICSSSFIFYHVARERFARHGERCVWECRNSNFYATVYKRWKHHKQKSYTDFESLRQDLLKGKFEVLNAEEVLKLVEKTREELVNTCECGTANPHPSPKNTQNTAVQSFTSSRVTHNQVHSDQHDKIYSRPVLKRAKPMPPPSAGLDTSPRDSTSRIFLQRQVLLPNITKDKNNLRSTSGATFRYNIHHIRRHNVPGRYGILFTWEPRHQGTDYTEIEILKAYFGMLSNTITRFINVSSGEAWLASFVDENARAKAFQTPFILRGRQIQFQNHPEERTTEFRCVLQSLIDVEAITTAIRRRYANPAPWIGLASNPLTDTHHLAVRFIRAPNLSRIWIWNNIATHALDPVDHRSICSVCSSFHLCSAPCSLFKAIPDLIRN